MDKLQMFYLYCIAVVHDFKFLLLFKFKMIFSVLQLNWFVSTESIWIFQFVNYIIIWLFL